MGNLPPDPWLASTIGLGAIARGFDVVVVTDVVVVVVLTVVVVGGGSGVVVVGTTVVKAKESGLKVIYYLFLSLFNL